MTEQALYDYAVSFLAKKDYASGALRKILKRESDDEELIETVMEKLLSHHYVDDSRLIDKELQKQVNKLHGPTRIKQELRQKGLDTLLIEQAIEDLDVDWFDICQQAKEKKFSDNLPSDSKEKAKMVRYLQYRGHSMSVIMDILSSNWRGRHSTRLWK